MELLLVMGCVLFLLWRILSAGKAATLPIPPEIPAENRAAFQVSWLAVCFAVCVIALALLVGVAGAGMAIVYEQRGLCDNTVRVDNGPFGDVGQCVDLVLPRRER